MPTTTWGMSATFTNSGGTWTGPDGFKLTVPAGCAGSGNTITVYFGGPSHRIGLIRGKQAASLTYEVRQTAGATPNPAYPMLVQCVYFYQFNTDRSNLNVHGGGDVSDQDPGCWNPGTRYDDSSTYIMGAYFTSLGYFTIMRTYTP